jgi:hypothetical protein
MEESQFEKFHEERFVPAFIAAMETRGFRASAWDDQVCLLRERLAEMTSAQIGAAFEDVVRRASHDELLQFSREFMAALVRAQTPSPSPS